MRLLRLSVRNFGPFRDYQDVELRPLDRTRPVILFGGLNGAGKTTILEAVRLSLFGRRSLGTRVSEREYHAYLAEKIHRPPEGLPASRGASICLAFEHGHAGERNVYQVRRAWERRGKRIVEDLVVFRNGLPLRDMSSRHWQEFIHGLVPPALAGLFFFDAERVQALAEDADDLGLAQSIRELLGLELVEQLGADLGAYLDRQTDEPVTDLESRRSALRTALSDVGARHARLCQQAASCRARLDQQQARIRRHEDRVAEQGGSFAEHRGGLQAEAAHLDAARDAAEEELRASCSGLLPFALVPNLCKELIAALDQEEQQQHASVLHEVVSILNRELEDDDFWTADGEKASGILDPVARDTMRRRLLDRLSARLRVVGLGREGATAAALVHGLAPTDSARIKLDLSRALFEVGPDAARVADRIARIDARRQEIEDDLRRAPNEEEVRGLLDQLSALHTDLGTIAHQLETTEAEIKEADAERQRIQRDLDRVDGEIARREDSSRRVALAAAVRLALADFHDALMRARLEELERTVALCFNRLARKDDLIGHIRIEPETMRVSLFNRDGQPVPKTALSAGEKQVYAIALLWALAQVSGRKLPVIVDTPLARLDSEHRRRLVEAYFPFAAEQVIVLSTDTEVDREFLQLIAPAVSRTCRLEYDPTGRASRMVEGYFWEIDGPGCQADGLRPDDGRGEGADGTRAGGDAIATLESAPTVA
jgi:DNA sulfur modification protein DndD